MRYIILILLCALSADAQMLRVGRRAAASSAAAIIQTASGSASINGSGDASISISASTAGSLLVVFAVTTSDNSSITIADNQSQTWSTPFAPGYKCYSTQYQQASCIFAYKANTASGVTSMTLHFSSSAFASTGYIVREYSGVATSSPLDVSSPTGTGALTTFPSSPWTSGSVTTTASDLLIGIGTGDVTSWAAGSGWTDGVAVSSGAYTNWVFMANKLTSSAGSHSASGTVASGTGGTGIVAFKLQ